MSKLCIDLFQFLIVRLKYQQIEEQKKRNERFNSL